MFLRSISSVKERAFLAISASLLLSQLDFHSLYSLFEILSISLRASLELFLFLYFSLIRFSSFLIVSLPAAQLIRVLQIGPIPLLYLPLSDSGTSDSGRSHSGRSYPGRLMHGFTTTFPMPVSRFTMNKKQDILDRGLDILAESGEIGVGMVRDKSTGDLFVLNHLEYDAETLKAEYVRDKKDGLDTSLPKNYFPEDKPELVPQNYWRPFAYLLCANWLNDLYQDTMFDLTKLNDDKRL